MSDEAIGRLFPAGGPVPPELVIGRKGDVDELERRLREALHTMVTGPRRIGKTTVCDAACDRVQGNGLLVIPIEIPERPDSSAFLQLLIDRMSRISLAASGRRALRIARPLIEKALKDQGIPLDLAELGAEPGTLPTRTLLSLPSELAEQSDRQVVLYLDELQRAVDYADGGQLLIDLVDLYSSATDVALLVNGSNERVLEGMLGPPIHFGKLCDRLPLAPTIPASAWRRGLPDRFRRAGLVLRPEAFEIVTRFGEERPYATMAAARYAALNARKLSSDEVGVFEAEEGVAEARRQLEDDE